MPIARRLSLFEFDGGPCSVQQALTPTGEPFGVRCDRIGIGLKAVGLLIAQRLQLLTAQIPPGAISNRGNEVMAKLAAAGTLGLEAAIDHTEQKLLQDFLHFGGRWQE